VNLPWPLNSPWLVLIGLGVLLVLVGALLLLPRLRSKPDAGSLIEADPCRSLLAAWQQAKGECDDARRAAEIAHATTERRVADEWVASHRVSNGEPPDVAAEQKAAEAAHAFVEAAREVARRAELQATEICARAAAAHSAYQDCVKERGSRRAASRSR
jgi:hypothetical protein